MEIPNTVTLRETFHGSGDKGMAVYGHEDTAGLGIMMEARRKDGRSPFVETWWLAALPDQSFATLAELQRAAAAISEEDRECEAARYPLIRSAEKDSCGNACRLCERPATWPRPKYDTTRVLVAVCWHPHTDWAASLCADHMAEFGDSPARLLAALRAESRN